MIHILNREFKLLIHSLRDFFLVYIPDHLASKNKYRFAFLVHPRNVTDVYRKYPISKFLPRSILESLLTLYWPVVITKITGLISQRKKEAVEGYIISIPLTARQMIENRALALKKITRAIMLAKKLGVRLIGLGGLTSSVTRGGQDILHINGIGITTGHAYTAHNIRQNLLELISIFEFNREKIILAIVGAGGSIGSTSAILAAHSGIRNFILIDVSRKNNRISDTLNSLTRINPNIDVFISHKISDIKNADIVIAATNAPEALIKSDDLKSGAIVLDDAQPSDVDPEVLKREDVLVVEAGVVHTPNIHNHFDFNLKSKNDNFCCLAEVLILASQEFRSHYIINRPTIEQIEDIAVLGNKLGFRIASFQNFQESISENKIKNIQTILAHKKN